MKEFICQSCSMPIVDDQQFGTDEDGKTNKDYCIYCYKDGKFIDDVSLEEYIKMNIQFSKQAGMTKEQMKEHCEKIFPTLKRWKNK